MEFSLFPRKVNTFPTVLESMVEAFRTILFLKSLREQLNSVIVEENAGCLQKIGGFLPEKKISRGRKSEIVHFYG